VPFLAPNMSELILRRWGAYSAPPDPLAGLRGPTSKGREKEVEERGRGKRREGEGKRGEGKVAPPFSNPWIRPWYMLSALK